MLNVEYTHVHRRCSTFTIANYMSIVSIRNAFCWWLNSIQHRTRENVFCCAFGRARTSAKVIFNHFRSRIDLCEVTIFSQSILFLTNIRRQQQ